MGVIGVEAQTTGTAKVCRPDKDTKLADIYFSDFPPGASASISGTDFDHYLTNNYYYGYCVTGNTFTVKFTNFKYEVTSVVTRCDRGNTTQGEADYTSTPLSGNPQTTHVKPSWQLSQNYYSITVAKDLVGLQTVYYYHTAGTSGTGNGEWMFLGSGTEGLLQVNYVYPTITSKISSKKMYSGETYSLASGDVEWTNQGAFSVGDIVMESSDNDCVSVSDDGKTLTAKSGGVATITAQLKNNGADVGTSNKFTFTVTVPYKLTDDSKNVYVYGDNINDDDIAGAYTFLEEKGKRNDNSLVYVEGGTYNGSKNNIVVKNDDSYTCANFVLTDKVDFYCPIDFTATNLSYSRTNTAGYNSVCMPFAFSSSNVNNGSIQTNPVYDSASNTVSFTAATSIEAGVPCFVECGSDDAGWNISLTNAKVTGSITESSMKGGYVKKTIGEGYLKLKSDGSVLTHSTASSTCTAFRSYLYLEGVPSAKSVNIAWGSLDDEATSITDTEANNLSGIETIYSVNGAKYQELQRGINIVKYTNGKVCKVLVR